VQGLPESWTLPPQHCCPHSTLYAYDYAHLQALDVIVSKQNRMNNRYNLRSLHPGNCSCASNMPRQLQLKTALVVCLVTDCAILYFLLTMQQAQGFVHAAPFTCCITCYTLVRTATQGHCVTLQYVQGISPTPTPRIQDDQRGPAGAPLWVAGLALAAGLACSIAWRSMFGSSPDNR